MDYCGPYILIEFSINSKSKIHNGTYELWLTLERYLKCRNLLKNRSTGVQWGNLSLQWMQFVLGDGLTLKEQDQMPHPLYLQESASIGFHACICNGCCCRARLSITLGRVLPGPSLNVCEERKPAQYSSTQLSFSLHRHEGMLCGEWRGWTGESYMLPDSAKTANHNFKS